MKEFIKQYKIYILTVIYLAILSVVYFTKPFLFTIVKGSSMEPTLHNGNILLFYQRKIENDKVGIFRMPVEWNQGDHLIIKRIAAKENDVVEISPEGIKVNDKFVRKHSNYEFLETKSFKVDKDKLFILGDNELASYDSFIRYTEGADDFLLDESKLLKTKDIKEIE